MLNLSQMIEICDVCGVNGHDDVWSGHDDVRDVGDDDVDFEIDFEIDYLLLSLSLRPLPHPCEADDNLSYDQHR